MGKTKGQTDRMEVVKLSDGSYIPAEFNNNLYIAYNDSLYRVKLGGLDVQGQGETEGSGKEGGSEA